MNTGYNSQIRYTFALSIMFLITYYDVEMNFKEIRDDRMVFWYLARCEIS